MDRIAQIWEVYSGHTYRRFWINEFSSSANFEEKRLDLNLGKSKSRVGT